jgi:hypothetical protein
VKALIGEKTRKLKTKQAQLLEQRNQWKIDMRAFLKVTSISSNCLTLSQNESQSEDSTKRRQFLEVTRKSLENQTSTLNAGNNHHVVRENLHVAAVRKLNENKEWLKLNEIKLGNIKAELRNALHEVIAVQLIVILISL